LAQNVPRRSAGLLGDRGPISESDEPLAELCPDRLHQADQGWSINLPALELMPETWALPRNTIPLLTRIDPPIDCSPELSHHHPANQNRHLPISEKSRKLGHSRNHLQEPSTWMHAIYALSFA